MRLIEDWLAQIGMDRYAAAFANNDIDVAVLPHLTDADLEKIGVSLGHRRKMLTAIAELSGETPAPPEHHESAERRQITVMFSDLVGSTELATHMDPEDLRDVMSAYQKCVAQTVRRFGGFVAKYMGDGVLAYFGYPQAHEDDAERAVRAGLDLIAGIAALKASVPLRSRVGIATGVVVVGDLIGSGEAQERGIVGETPNLAARLQGVAEPNGLVISEATRKLIGNLFELQDLGARTLKGISSPVRMWAPLRSNPVASRFEALRADALTPLVGRLKELDLLLQQWEQAKAGEARVVLLSGEPGIGKSRLANALLERISSEVHARLSYSCSPQHADSALYPVIGQMEQAAGFIHSDTLKERLDKLDALLAATSSSGLEGALFADLLFLQNDGRYPDGGFAPDQRRERTLRALLAGIEKSAQRRPLLIFFEDAHWSDPTTLEFLSRVITSIRSLSVLTIVTFRPEFCPPWEGQSHVTSLPLERLGDQEVASIAAQIVGQQGLPASVLKTIAERADGIPLFVEEITKAVIESETNNSARHATPADPGQALSVPASLHASLMARLDRLGAAKETAQIGAAIGREFSQHLLSSVTLRSDRDIRQALDQLVGAGLIFRQGASSRANYLFKHALVRDAAYGTLLRGARRALHLATSWKAAGQRSLARSALAEAEIQLSRALSQIATLPGSPSLRRDQIGLQVELVTVLMHTKGYGAEETKAAAARAQSLIEQAEAIGEAPEDPLILFSVIYGFWVVNIAGFNGDAAQELAAQFWQLAEKQASTGPFMLAHRVMGMTQMSVGNLIEGKEHLDQAIALYDPIEHRGLSARFGTDARVATLEWRSRAHWLLGYSEAARRDANLSFRYAREIDQAATLMHALAHSTAVLILRGDFVDAGSLAEELVSLAEEKKSTYWRANGKLWEGCLLVLAGRSSEATEILNSELAVYRSTGATIYTPFVMSHLAWAYAEVGKHADALQIIERAIATVRSTKEKWCEAEVHRIAGEIALKSPARDKVKAEAYFEHSITLARAQQARSWELRTAMSMARLLDDRGKRELARNLLAPIYSWFTEGFETRDLRQAKALLGELG